MKSHKVNYRIAFIIFMVLFSIALSVSILLYHKQINRHDKSEESIEFYKRKIIEMDRSILWLNKDFPVLKKVEKLILAKKPQNKTDLINMSRWFVRNGFIVKYDKWYDENKYDTELVLETIYNNHVNPSSEPAHLDCQPSARALACILNFLGFQTRLVAFLSDDYDDFVASHAMVEVLNSDSGKWEVQDPLYNIFFYNVDTGQRLSALDLVFGNTEKIMPSNGMLDGWETKMPSRYAETKDNYTDARFKILTDPRPRILKDHYFEVLAYKYITPKGFVFVNNKKISLTKRFPENDNLTILEFIRKVYGNPPVFMFPPGEYEAY